MPGTSRPAGAQGIHHIIADFEYQFLDDINPVSDQADPNPMTVSPTGAFQPVLMIQRYAHLTIHGQAGQRYQIQATSALNPDGPWTRPLWKTPLLIARGLPLLYGSPRWPGLTGKIADEASRMARLFINQDGTGELTSI